MKCFHCGAEVKSKYCPECDLHNGKGDKKNLQSFTAYVNSGKFKKIKNPKKSIVNKEECTIHVCLLRRVKNSLRQVNGSRTPVKIFSNADYNEVKQQSFDKLKRYVPEMKDYKYTDIELTYRSGERALYLPGTPTDFTLEKYKEDRGCGYSKITMYLKPWEEAESDM